MEKSIQGETQRALLEKHISARARQTGICKLCIISDCESVINCKYIFIGRYSVVWFDISCCINITKKNEHE